MIRALLAACALTAAVLLGGRIVGGVGETNGTLVHPVQQSTQMESTPVLEDARNNTASPTNELSPVRALGRDLAPDETVRVLRYEDWVWLRTWFPGRQWTMARVVTCESDFDDGAVGAQGERGKLQIMEMHAVARGLAPEALHDPGTNGAVGAELLAARPDGGDWAGTLGGCETWSAR